MHTPLLLVQIHQYQTSSKLGRIKLHQIKGCANMPYIRNKIVRIFPIQFSVLYYLMLNNAHPENTHSYQCTLGKRVLTDDQSGGFSHETGLPCSRTGSISCASRGEREGVRSAYCTIRQVWDAKMSNVHKATHHARLSKKLVVTNGLEKV